mgnify:CR=1 FL=1
MRRLLAFLPLRTWLILGVIVIVLLMLLSWRSACASRDQTKDQFARWDKNDGKVMKGLTRRRAAEAALYGGGNG